MINESTCLQEAQERSLEPYHLSGSASSSDASCLQPAAYELKFLIAENWASEVIGWARQNLRRDPNVDPLLDDSYQISSLYFDTPALDTFYRRRPFRRAKYRLRRYGAERVFYLERKRKAGDRVQKQRTQIRSADLMQSSNTNGIFPWLDGFAPRTRVRDLQPLCQVNYQRAAYIGGSIEDPIRLTLDRQLFCGPVTEEMFKSIPLVTRLLPGQRVLELKYCGRLPALFKRVMHELNLDPKPISKYRLSVDALNLRGN